MRPLVGEKDPSRQVKTAHGFRERSRRHALVWAANPMGFLGLAGGSINCRIASNKAAIWSSCPSIRFSSSVSFRRSSSSVDVISRRRIKAQTTWMLASTATALFRTLATMTAPCSVNT